MTIRTPHHRLFKSTFTQLEHAASELKAVLPAAIVEHADWTTLSLESGEYIDHELQHLHSDLLYSVQMQGRPGLLYVVFEHQSTPDGSMSHRLLRYVSRVWDRWRADHPEGLLPPVVPVVLHHGSAGWAAATELHDLVDMGSGDVAEALGPYVPNFRFVLDDLAVLDDEQLRARAVTELVRATLVVLQRVRGSTDPDALLRPWMQTLLAVLTAPDGIGALSAVVRYIIEASDAAPEEIRRFFKELGPGAQEAFVTAAEKLTQEARAEERAKALVEGQVAILKRQVTRRFGPLSNEVQQRLETADEAQLERWADAVLTAESLEDLLSGR